MSLHGSFFFWKAWLGLHAVGWRITVFPHNSGVVQGSQIASGLTEGRDLPITEQISTATGDGGSCQHCCASDSTRQRHQGYPYLFSTVTDEGPFVAQCGHTIFPSLDASRVSPFPFSLKLPLSLKAGLDARALLVSILQTCNVPCQEGVLARLPWAMPSPFQAPRLWTSFSFPLSDQTFTVNELSVGSPSLCPPRRRAPQGRSLQLQQRGF